MSFAAKEASEVDDSESDDDEDDLTDNSSSINIVKEDAQKDSSKTLDIEMEDIAETIRHVPGSTMNKANPQSNSLMNTLDLKGISQLVEDKDQLDSRIDQNRFKNSNKKAVGITAAIINETALQDS